MTDDRTPGLLTIGDFAREAGLTPKALRLYDDLGLLRPAQVDAHSGYRRYAVGQLERARLVATLRLVGMPLARIEQVLNATPAEAARQVEAYWRQVEHDTASRRSIVTTLVQQMRNEAPAMSTTTHTLQAEIGTSHRTGARERQQDALLATPGLVAVADGFGARDDLAAAVLAAFAVDGFDGATAEVAADLGTTPADAPTSGTTLTAVRFDGSTARVVHVGDGRAWLVRAGTVEQLTHDHTVVAALIESGQLTLDEARSHAHRSLLNRAVVPGVVPDEVDVPLRAGDRLVLTTDGVHATVDDLAPLLASPQPAQEVADAVADAVAAAGEVDNHTIVVVDLT
ncbi:Serine/threonine protein phosphatase PrpC [Nocardioides exalbidus]|uniref:Serine/threonine protein phosphatase PrpC n=1 Tax=Nocardioides exalbidus TaxID=402596 RepID=A0A1H4Z474_9ACTN|nr:MerR family transcriptional regulator [Nocardioides exalbidus]SED24675.1 Serine/threonine protein phosphatase PrpC [Nocardioides exalbidus]